jgi:hypothetical protein
MLQPAAVTTPDVSNWQRECCALRQNSTVASQTLHLAAFPLRVTITNTCTASAAAAAVPLPGCQGIDQSQGINPMLSA